jgi:hypothetical protein
LDADTAAAAAAAAFFFMTGAWRDREQWGGGEFWIACVLE